MRRPMVVLFLFCCLSPWAFSGTHNFTQEEPPTREQVQTSRQSYQSNLGCPGADPNDPFQMNLRYPYGPRRGQCMRLDEYRPIHILTSEEAESYALKAGLPSPVPGEIWIANVRHQDKFWVARIPKDAVDNVFFEIERFDYGGKILSELNRRRWYAAHAEVRFKFKKGKEAVFIPQLTNDKSKPQELSDIVVSSEAVRRKGESFNPIKGNRDHYGLAKRVLSLDQVLQDSLVKLGHEVAQYPIQIRGNADQVNEQRQKYLLSALKRSDKDWQSYHSGKPVMYNTADRNCISDALDIFDDVTNYRYFSNAEKAQPEVLPKHLLSDLFQRELIPNMQRRQYPTLNQETGIPFRQK